jgi:hypothetical protein
MVIDGVGGVEEAAKIIGRSRDTVKRYISGATDVSLSDAARLADKAGRSVQWIVSGRTKGLSEAEGLIREAVGYVFDASRAFQGLSRQQVEEAVVKRLNSADRGESQSLALGDLKVDVSARAIIYSKKASRV